MSAACRHTKFKSEAVVKDMEDGTYMVDVTAHCAECFKPLRFVGMPMGIHPEKPTISLDGTEARLNAKLFS